MVSITVGRWVVPALLAALACLPLPTAVVANSTTLIWPTSGRITQPYGCTGFYAEPRRGSCGHFHGGIDIANSRGTPVVAAADGVIDLVGWDPWIRPDPDWMVIINHPGGLQTMYAHLRAKPVDGITKGAHVTQGQLIGLMDMTGHATGPHLHFAVILDGNYTNPRGYLAGSPKPPRPAHSAGQARSCTVPVSGGVGAWLGGATAFVAQGEGPGGCPA